MRQTCLVLLFAALAFLFTAPARAACHVVPQSTVPVEIVRNTPLTTVQVNDVDATFIVDTGAYRTLMGDDAVRNLKLERDQWVATAIRGIGGVQERPDAPVSGPPPWAITKRSHDSPVSFATCSCPNTVSA